MANTPSCQARTSLVWNIHLDGSGLGSCLCCPPASNGRAGETQVAAAGPTLGLKAKSSQTLLFDQTGYKQGHVKGQGLS